MPIKDNVTLLFREFVAALLISDTFMNIPTFTQTKITKIFKHLQEFKLRLVGPCKKIETVSKFVT